MSFNYDKTKPFYEVSDVLDNTIGRFNDRDDAARFTRESGGTGPWGPFQPGQETPF